MKTPEEIKLALETCIVGNCKKCSYREECDEEKFAALASDTLDLISDLELQNIMSCHECLTQKVERTPKWRSVQSDKPKPGQWVLAYCGGYANWYELNKWCGNGWLKAMPVTHWMPIPEISDEVV